MVEHPDAGVVKVEVGLPDFHALLDRLADLGLDGGVVPTWLYLEAGIVVQEADQQDRALVGSEAFSEFADVADKPVGGVQRRAWPGLDVAAEGDLEVVERGFDLEVGGVVDQEIQPCVTEDLFARRVPAVIMAGSMWWVRACSTKRFAAFWLIPIQAGARVPGGSTEIASTV